MRASSATSQGRPAFTDENGTLVTHPLDRLLAPRSIAIVGASDRPDSNGHAMFAMSRIDGYEGRVYPINPRVSQLGDLPCYPDLASLPEVPEHVVIGVASHLVEDVLDEVIALGVSSTTIFASCILPEEKGPRLTERIAEKARRADLAICGANCMGFYTPRVGLRVASMPSPAGLRRGGIAWIAQSGSAMGALGHNDRRLGFSLCISTGMELATTVSDYMDWALDQDDTRVIGLFLETVRNHEHFVAMLKRAADRGIPVVVLKVGRTALSAQMAVSHTGALAGNDAAFEAVFRKYGVTRVQDLDEMAATLALFDTGRKPGAGGFASIHDSGGERELVVDLADDIGLSFPNLDAATKAAMEDHLEIGLQPENPLDAFGTNRGVEKRFAALTEAMMHDPGIALTFFMANPRDGYPYAEKYVAAVCTAARRSPQPVAVVSNYGLTQDAKLAQALLEADVPLLRGTAPALRAAKHVLAYRAFRERPVASGAVIPELPPDWGAQLAKGIPLGEADALPLLQAYGMRVPKSAQAASAADLRAALSQLAYPLVLKTAEAHAHKSDVGGVVLGIEDAGQGLAAYERLAQRLGPRVFAMEMAPKGVELAMGAIWDDGFGPVVVLSAGGIWVELFDDKVAAMAPFDEAEAHRLIAHLRIYAALKGVRGQPPVDFEDLARQISLFSVMVASLGPQVTEIDVNPLLCSEHGAFAVDCLIVPRAR